LKYLVFITLLMLGSGVNANENMSLEEYCKFNPCRKNLKMTLKQKDGSLFERTFTILPPVVQPTLISIFAGETLYIEATEGEEGPTDFVQVKTIRNPERTLVFKFEQQKDVGDGKSMLLTVKNPFSKTLRYKLGMMPLDMEKLVKTSSCPVAGGQSVFESWPYPIFQIVIGKIHFQKKDDDGSCK